MILNRFKSSISFFFPERNNKRKQKFQTVRAADAEGV